MKKHTFIAGYFIATIGLIGCNSNEKNGNQEVKDEPKKETSSPILFDTLAAVEGINKMRTAIEALEINPFEISTSGLREKTKQKWSKIHFYVQNDVVIKVKTYPYSEISKRTEEFYANKDGLALVVIEDDGEGSKGKPKNELDKMYYFNNGKPIKELNKEAESEYTIKTSDAEELLAEYEEYLDIYKKAKK